jgi:hypothetical protein
VQGYLKLSLVLYIGCSNYNFVIISNTVAFYIEVTIYLEKLYLKLIAFSIVLI